MPQPDSSTDAPRPGSWHRLPRAGLQALLDALAAAGHRVVGPQVADGAVVLRDLADAARLPHGWLDEQDGGLYRLRHDPAAGTFDHVVGPHSLKNFLFPPRETLARYDRVEGSWHETAVADESPPLAVIGVRACDLAALAVQDRVFIRDDYVDEAYARRRTRLFIVAVNCRRAAATCFCHSMGTGPAVAAG
ncbi:MAG: sulfite reductase subunit A, partial [Planctomycetaceae bacterium]